MVKNRPPADSIFYRRCEIVAQYDNVAGSGNCGQKVQIELAISGEKASL